MTREEAIRHIESIKPYAGRNIKDALDMAIKALEQESRWISVSERLPKFAGVYRVTRYYPGNVVDPKYIKDFTDEEIVEEFNRRLKDTLFHKIGIRGEAVIQERM